MNHTIFKASANVFTNSTNTDKEYGSAKEAMAFKS